MTAVPEPDISYQLDARPAGVSQARECTRKVLADWGLPEHIDLAQLIISELVTNAICHGSGPITVRLSHTLGELHFKIHDFGPGRPARCQPSPQDESGRGLDLIDTLIALHGGVRTVVSDDVGPGRTVCTTVHLTASAVSL